MNLQRCSYLQIEGVKVEARRASSQQSATHFDAHHVSKVLHLRLVVLQRLETLANARRDVSAKQKQN
jgi:hypothetical protein